MAFATQLNYVVIDTGTGLGVTGLTAAGSFTTFKVSEDGTLQADIKATASITDQGAGYYTFAYTTIGTPVKELKVVPVMATAAYQAYPVVVGAESLRQLANTPVTANQTQVNGHSVTDTTSGVQDVNMKNAGNVAVTGRDIGASILLSPGTGTGQLDITSGVVKSNLVQILGTALTETAGYIAAGFKAFFNLATPVTPASGKVPATIAAGDSVDCAANKAATVVSTGTCPAQSQTTPYTVNQTIKLAAGASSVDNFFKYMTIVITGGTGIGQSRRFLDYVGATQLGTVDRAWATNPDNTSTYSIGDYVHILDLITTGYAQGSGTGNNQIQLKASESVNTNELLGQRIQIKCGTGAMQFRTIIAYNGSTKTATVDRNWSVNPDATSFYAILDMDGYLESSMVDPGVTVTIGTTQMAQLLGISGGQVIKSSDGSTVQKYDKAGNLLVTLTLSGTTWSASWAV